VSAFNIQKETIMIKKDLTGQIFGRLKVIKENGRNNRNEVLWLCRCLCNRKVTVKSYNLTSGATKSCGCLKPGNKPLDLTGQKFNRLTVIKLDSIDKWREYHYCCRCDCGNIKILRRSHLINGDVKSCGCWNKERRHTGYGDISGTYWGIVKSGAKLRNLTLDIDIIYINDLYHKQNKRCALTNTDIYISKYHYKNKKQQTASLDRIDSKLGYTKENVQWVHKDINKMKQDLPEQVFIELCQKVIDNVKTNSRN